MNQPPIRSIAIAGIHTGIGKTIAAAVIAEALEADYWKPVQAGLEERDMHTVQHLLSNGANRVHPEAIALQEPASPHASAAAEGIFIDYTTFHWPTTPNTLLVETAGGILSPMSDNKTMADFITHFNLPVILISQNYLGSINHTLMTIEVLKSRGITILGIIMNGAVNEASESFIEQYSGLKIAAHIPHFNTLDAQTISNCAIGIKEKLLQIVSN